MGDTQRPLLFITIAGIVNVLLNIFFVTLFKMDAAGVALATKIASALSALLVLRTLYQSPAPIRLYVKKIRFHWDNLKEILWIGIPAGIQGALYCVPNLFIQASVNTLGSITMAGNAACQSLEGISNVASGTYYQTAMSFTGQNLGGKKYKRIVKSILVCLLYATGFALFSNLLFLVFGKFLLGLYNPNPDVVASGMERLLIMMSTYFLCGIMDTITGALRGLGHSVMPTVMTILGACGLRIFWVLMVFPHFRTLRCLMTAYPVSWFLTATLNGLLLYFICRKMIRKAKESRGITLHPGK
jgi:Na+-driven multidrug efflux pump